MSKENVQLFIEKIQNDEELQKKLTNVYKKDRKILQTIVKFGGQVGYTFTEVDVRQVVEELNNRMVENVELDDTQLETVVGGNADAWNALTEFEYTACLHSTVRKCDPKRFLHDLKY